MLSRLIAFLPLLATAVASPSAFISRLEYSTVPARTDCNATCEAYEVAVDACQGARRCECSDKCLQTLGECLVCPTETVQDVTEAQVFLNTEVHRCRVEGIPTTFKFHLSSDSPAIFDEFYHQSARLQQQQTAFLALHITGGHIGLGLVLAISLFSPKFHRDPTFLNFCITWIVSSVVYSTLLYRGAQGNTLAQPLGSVSDNTCLAQAAFINGSQVMTACSTMVLVMQLWIRLRGTVRNDISYVQTQRKGVTYMLLALPYIFFFAFSIPSMFVGKTFLGPKEIAVHQVVSTNFYCSIVGLKPFSRALYGVTLGLLVITTVFDALIIFIVYQSGWPLTHVKTKHVVSLPMLLRVIIFSIYRVVVAVTYGAVLSSPPQVYLLPSALKDLSYGVPVWVDMLQAAVPLVGFIVFGLNGGILSGLLFWRTNATSTLAEQTTHTETLVDSPTTEFNNKMLDEKIPSYEFAKV